MSKNTTAKGDDARVIWAKGCEPPRTPLFPPNNEARILACSDREVVPLYALKEGGRP